ncbi:helix-turn-helix transcriptional regulator [Vibrio kanaloae]|nr:helix-turn-helix transcriptional regulator [Vibrio kanaloae]
MVILSKLKNCKVLVLHCVRGIAQAFSKIPCFGVDQRLKELENENMVIRRVLNEKPLAVSYELTEFGRSALNILDELRKWSESNDIQLK